MQISENGTDPVQANQNQSGRSQHAAEKSADEERIGSSLPSTIAGWHPDEKNHRQKEKRYWQLSILLNGVAVTGALVGSFLALQAVRSSQTQIAIMRETETKQLRAYAGLSRSKLDKAFNALITFSNSGQTPALDVQVEGFSGIENYPLDGDITDLQRSFPTPLSKGSRTVLLKDVELNLPINVDQAKLPAIVQSVINPQKRFYVWGNVKYLDVFNEKHISNFCIRFGADNIANGTYEFCEQHNDGD